MSKTLKYFRIDYRYASSELQTIRVTASDSKSAEQILISVVQQDYSPVSKEQIVTNLHFYIHEITEDEYLNKIPIDKKVYCTIEKSALMSLIKKAASFDCLYETNKYEIGETLAYRDDIVKARMENILKELQI